MTVPESSSLIDEPLIDEVEVKISFGSKILLYVVAGLSTCANFIATTFAGLYAVFIESSTTALSLITSLRNLFQQIFQPIFGRISDFIGRKIVIFIGIVVSGACLAVLPFINNQWLLVVGVAIFSLGFSIYSPAFTALQGDLTNRKNRAGFISIITIIGAIATAFGLLIVGFLSDLGDTEKLQYTIILEIVAGIYFISAVVSLFLYDPSYDRLKERHPLTLRPIIENASFRKFVILNSIMAFSMALGWPLFPFVRGTFATPKENTWSWAIFAALQIIILLITYKTINKTKRKWLLYLGRFLMFYVPLNLALTIRYIPTWWHIAIAGGVSGACNALYMVGQNAYILDCATKTEKGTYTGVHNLFIGLSTFIGSLIMGIVADQLIIFYDKWDVYFNLLLIVAGVRFLAGFGFLFLGDPQECFTNTKEEKFNEHLLPDQS